MIATLIVALSFASVAQVSDTGARIGPSGGTLTASGGELRLEIPPGALRASTLVHLARVPVRTTDPGMVVGSFIEVGLATGRFARPALLSIAYLPDSLPAGIAASRVTLQLRSNDSAESWVALPGAASGSASVSAEISGAGRYAVRRATVSGPCPAEAAREFSFWAGRWNYSVPGYDPAVNAVTSEAGNCVWNEQWVDSGGHEQRTLIVYDPEQRLWQRTVIDPFHRYTSRGRFSDGAIGFVESATERETYRPVDADHVAFFGEHSDDGGRTWRETFRAIYTRQ